MKIPSQRLFGPENAGGASGGIASPAPSSWSDFDASKLGAEKPFKVRSGKQEATVVLNQHGQLLLVNDRRLLGWMPEQMAL